MDNAIAAMEARHPNLTTQMSFYVESNRACQTLSGFGRWGVVYRHGHHKRGVGAPVTLKAHSVVIFVEFEFRERWGNLGEALVSSFGS